MMWVIVGGGLLAASFLLGRLSVQPQKHWLAGYLCARNVVYLRPMALRRK